MAAEELGRPECVSQLFRGVVQEAAGGRVEVLQEQLVAEDIGGVFREGFEHVETSIILLLPRAETPLDVSRHGARSLCGRGVAEVVAFKSNSSRDVQDFGHLFFALSTQVSWQRARWQRAVQGARWIQITRG